MMISSKPTGGQLIGTLLSALVSLVIGLADASQVLAQSSPWQSNSSANDFENEGRPPSRTSAGSRDACSAQLIALVPGRGALSSGMGDCSAASESLLSLTLNRQPTFWFYVPPQVDSSTSGVFALLDEAQRPLQIEPVTLRGGAGIVGVPLSQPLEPNKVYRWVFSITGSSSRPGMDLYVEGFVKHIEPDAALMTRLASSSDSERLTIYTQQGIWHDALTLLITLHPNPPADFAWMTHWSQLLDSAGLGAIATAPLLDCCTPSSNPQPNRR